MKNLSTIMLIGAVLFGTACNDTTKSDATGSATAPQPASQDPHAAFKDLPIDSVASLVESRGCVPIDANNPDTRSEYGVLPGAVLLSDSHEFQPGELPADKNTKLVFYCGSKKCTAAPKAATRAAAEGYKDVNVMSEGIRGWVAAGQKVDKPAT